MCFVLQCRSTSRSTRNTRILFCTDGGRKPERKLGCLLRCPLSTLCYLCCGSGSEDSCMHPYVHENALRRSRNPIWGADFAWWRGCGFSSHTWSKDYGVPQLTNGGITGAIKSQAVAWQVSSHNSGPKTDLSWMFRELREGRYLLGRSELHFHARCFEMTNAIEQGNYVPSPKEQYKTQKHRPNEFLKERYPFTPRDRPRVTTYFERPEGDEQAFLLMVSHLAR